MKIIDAIKEILRDREERKSAAELLTVLVLLALVIATLLYHMRYLYGG